ncbi:MAG: hypothetical protein Q9222_002294 [Ikaeria aurantiellina]
MDPVTTLCSLLTIADASKKISDKCSYYMSHVRNAPKELQRINEDLRALEETVIKLDDLSEAQQRNDRWRIPLSRIEDSMVKIAQRISQLDMKSEHLLLIVSQEKAQLHLATSMHGTEMIGMVFDIVKERLPIEPSALACEPSFGSEGVWEKVDAKHCPLNQTHDFIVQKLGDLIDRKDAIYTYPYYEDPHQSYLARSVDYPKESFLESPPYLAWKNRKPRGPALLCVSGAPATGNSRIIQDIQRSKNNQVGVAFFHFGSSINYNTRNAHSFWIIQLALQCNCLPAISKTGNSIKNESSDLSEVEKLFQYPETLFISGRLLRIFFSLLPRFRRTFLLIDGLGEDDHERIEMLQSILGQGHGDVSVATFARVTPTSLLQDADISIRLAHFQPNLDQYTSFRIHTKVKPALRDVHLSYDEDFLSRVGSIISEAAHGLYLGVDILTDSLVTSIRKGDDIEVFLRRTREGNEIMLQRDPESMKQKAFGIDTLTPLERPAKSSMPFAAPAAESSRESR